MQKFAKKGMYALALLTVATVIAFTGCKESDSPLFEEGIAPAKQAVSIIVWNGQVDKDVAAQNVPFYQNDTRKNASGAKITSNAHSADFPGIYFIWDSKQKDNGYLKVDADIFDTYSFFILTAKESNTYWDFVIMPQPDQLQTDDGCYVFYIRKVYNNKNINMVFVAETKQKLGDPVEIRNKPKKERRDGNNCLLDYFIVSEVGPGFPNGVIVDPQDKWHCGGMTETIKTHWTNTIRNNPNYTEDWDIMTSIKSKNGSTPNWIWDRDDSWEYGISGAQMIVYVNEFDIDGTIDDEEVWFYYACDNAAVVYVNGTTVSHTEHALVGRDVPNYPNYFKGCTQNDFDGNYWQHLYKVNIKPLLDQGKNKIVVLAANSNDNNGTWNKENNPAGLIFGCKFTVNTCK